MRQYSAADVQAIFALPDEKMHGIVKKEKKRRQILTEKINTILTCLILQTL